MPGGLLPVAQIERRKGLRLANFDDALAHQFETGGKRTGDRRRPFLGACEIVEQEGVERRPVAEAADQAGQNVARLLQRPDGALGDVHVGDGLALALRRVGGKQVVERGGVFVALFDDHQFRHAARKDVAAEPVAVDQPGADVAHGFETLQAELQDGGQFLAALALVARQLGNQQLRLEIGEPGRHHEIVGGKFQPQLSRVFDKDEILLGERQDGDSRQIDLLVARKVQEQIERTFETGDIDDQRRIAGEARVRVLGP